MGQPLAIWNMCMLSFLLIALSILNQCDIELVRSQNKRLSIEIAFSKMCHLNRIVDKKKLFEELNESDGDLEVEIKPEIKQENPPEKIHSKEVFDLENPESDKKEETKVEEKLSPVTTDKNPVIKSSLKKIGPTLSTNVDSLLNDLQKKNQEIKSKGKDLTEQNLIEIFSTYKDTVESKALRTALEYTKFKISDNEISVLTPTQIYIDYIRQELKLLEIIHDSFPEKDLKIKFDVSEESFPEYTSPKKPKHFTTKEKYDLLNSINPLNR